MNGKSTRIILCLLLLVLFTANDAIGAPKSKRGVTVTPKAPPSLSELYQNSHAVIIGVNRYEKWPSLEYAVNDAKAMEAKLKALGFETTTLIDHNATRSNIVRILGDELPRKVEQNDRVVIFFAGHGQTEELADGSQMGYIVPVDADTRDIFSTAISMDQVRNFSKRLKAKHVLYLMDSCYSGLGLSRSGTLPPSERDYLRKITTRKAHQMLTAGGKGEQAKEEGAHGLFTKYVLEALDGQADRDEKGYITFSDLASYVKPKVSREAGNSQTPQYGNIDGEGEFVFVTGSAMLSVSRDEEAITEERQKIALEKKKLEEEKARIDTLREQRKEIAKLTEERLHLEEERKRLEQEKRSHVIVKDEETITPDLMENFGMTVQEISPEIYRHLGISDRSGVIVVDVKNGSPAEKVGIQLKDIILQVNKVKIFSVNDYLREISKKSTRELGIMLIRRGESSFFVSIRTAYRNNNDFDISKQKSDVARPQLPPKDNRINANPTKKNVPRGWIGISVQDVTEDIAMSLKLKEKGGALVADVFKGDPADRAGLMKGDVIIDVNRITIKDTHELLNILAAFHVGERIEVKIVRDGIERTASIVVAERKK